MKTMTVALVLAAAAFASGGCSKDKAKAKTVPTDPKPGPAVAEKKAAPAVDQDTAVTPSLAISPDILAACGIKVVASANPTFDTDEDKLTDDDRQILEPRHARPAGGRFRRRRDEGRGHCRILRLARTLIEQ